MVVGAGLFKLLSINDDDIIGPNDLNIILKKYNAGDKVIIKYLRDNKIKTSELTLGSYKGSTFTQLENERGKDFTDITNNINTQTIFICFDQLKQKFNS